MDKCDCEINDETTLKNINILDNSIIGIVFVIIGVLMSLKTTKDTKDQLIASQCAPETLKCFPDNFSSRVTSNLIITTALAYFYSVTEKNLRTNTDPTNCSPLFNHIASILVISATVIRLYDIFYTRKRTLCGLETTQASTEEEEAFV